MPAKGDHNEPTKRPNPRRLFSLESLKSATSSRRSSSDNDTPARTPFQHQRTVLSPSSDLSQVREGGEDELEAEHAHVVLEKPSAFFAEPESMSISMSSPETTRTASPTPSSARLEPIRTQHSTHTHPTAPRRPFSPDVTTPTPSPTRARWESIRKQVLAPSIASRPSTPPQPHRPASAQSNRTDTLLSGPERSTTPKPSRLVRLGFKHVVENALSNRDVFDEARRFGDEILRACAAARQGDGSVGGKVSREREREASSTSTLSGGSAASANGSGSNGNSLRPQSMASVSTPSLNTAAATAVSSSGPTVRILYQHLVHYSGLVLEHGMTITTTLPHEALVLSTLLCPFLTPGKYPMMRLEDERIIAIESFEILFKSWLPADEPALAERCLWCTRVAASLPPGPLRTRILSPLWRLLVPGDRNKTNLSVAGFQSIASGLLRLLAALHSPLLPSPSPHNAYPTSTSPAGFHPTTSPDTQAVQDIIGNFLSGSLGELGEAGLEEEYGVRFETRDRKVMGSVRRAVFVASLVNCMEFSRTSAQWILDYLVDEYWPLPTPQRCSPLLTAIHCKKINTFCRVASGIVQPFLETTSGTPMSSPESRLSSATSSSDFTLELAPKGKAVVQKVVGVIQTRLLPETSNLDSGADSVVNVVRETRIGVANVLLDMMCLEWEGIGSPLVGSASASGSPTASPAGKGSSRDVFAPIGDTTKEIIKWSMGVLCGWYMGGLDSEWRVVLDETFRRLMSGEWPRKLRVLFALLRHLPEPVKKSVLNSLFTALNDQIIDNPPPYPSFELSSFFTSFSRTYPTIFYKPLFACAASDKEFTVVNHLCTLQAHTKYVRDYWFRDVDMMCFALLGDGGGSGGGAGMGMPGQIGTARLGQLVLLVELIGQVQDVRHAKDAGTAESRFSPVSKFVTALESRLHLMIDAKEQTVLLPPSHRMLFCILFREFRLLSRSLKPAPWLSRTLSWFFEYCSEEDMEDFEQDVTTAMERTQGLYMAAQAGVQQGHKRHTSMLAAMSPKPAQTSPNEPPTKDFDLAATFGEHRKLIDSLSRGLPSRALKLFVAMSALVSNEDYIRLGPVLWQNFLVDNVDPSVTATACFLFMQCAERVPDETLALIEVDLRTSDEFTRLEAVRKLSVIINWRFQIISQQFVNDRNHRPFKLARPPLPFLSTDIGTSLYVHTEEINENRERDEVPLELKKRLVELGLTDPDGNSIDPSHDRIVTPFSLLPINQMDRLEVAMNESPLVPATSPQSSPHPSPRKNRGADRDHLGANKPSDDLAALLRRNSSSGGPVSGVRRRPIFVPALTTLFVRLTKLVLDPSYAVASAARMTLMDLMKNDPSLLTRPIFDYFSGEQKDLQVAMASFDAFLHVRRVLPPALTHHIFNNAAGFLKLAMRQVEDQTTLVDFGLLAPVIVHYAMQVSGMSIREIRRSKLEYLFIPSGAFWYPSEAPRAPMFPRNIGQSTNPFQPIPQRLVSMTMVRTAQNMFFLALLKRNYQDVQAIRKHIERFALPTLSDHAYVRPLETQDFVPRKMGGEDGRGLRRNTALEDLSLMLSRSHVLLVAQIFRSMSRHSNDRQEMSTLMEGLNRVLLAHGNDISVLSQVLIALMIASTRFRRLFNAGGGYTMFMPVVIRVYTENPSHVGIRLAIEYAVNRFYTLHKEAFLFQTLDAIGQVAMLPGVDTESFSDGVYGLFSSLRKPVNSSVLDVAGIRDANKSQEREALMLATAEEKPQTFLSAIRRVETQSGLQMTFQLAEEYESTGLKMEDFVKLFLTVIAHEPTASRAQHFLRILRYLTPHLYNTSTSARKTLLEGIGALGNIFLRLAKKGQDNPAGKVTRAGDEDAAFLPSEGAPEPSEKVRIPSDSKAMRLDYIQLALAFGRAGGQIPLPVARQGLEVFKSLLRDWSEPKYDTLSTVLTQFTKALLIRDDPPQVKSVITFLRDLAPILHSFMIVVDFSGVFEVVLKMCRIPMYAHDPGFGSVVVGEICSAGLAACDLAASEGYLMTLPCRPVLVELLSEAIFLIGVDIIGELEKRPPHYHFLAGVVLPLTSCMKTERQLIADTLRTPEHRRMQQAAWVRILHYCMSACQKSRKDDEHHTRGFRGLGGSFRSKASDKGQSEGAFWRSHLPTFVMALQVVKVIIIRGEADISIPRFAVWERIAAFLKQMLADGSAHFAFVPDILSANATPSGSPRASTQLQPGPSGPTLMVSSSSGFSRPPSPFSLDRNTFSRPRIVDYALWSMLEFVCALRSPLRAQLKLFTMDKVLALDRELRAQDYRNSSYSASPLSPATPRLSASLFTKSRKRSSMLPSSAGPSPDSSPYLKPTTMPNLLVPTPSLDIPPRRPGYQASPVTPPQGHPKIVHLGPTSPSAFLSSVSPIIGPNTYNPLLPKALSTEEDGTSPTSTGKATKIRSLQLIQTTYRRIRGVQAFMGYSLLLPLPGQPERDEDDVVVEHWSKHQGMGVIMSETNELLAEFEESAVRYGIQDSVMIEHESVATPLSPASFVFPAPSA